MDEKSNIQDFNTEELNAYRGAVWSYRQGQMASRMIHFGDRLGIYKAMDGAGPLTARDLAERTELNERFLLEWLRGQVAARLLTYHKGDRFELTPVGSAVLANEDDNLHFLAGHFSVVEPPDFNDRFADAFKTGIGLSWDYFGDSLTEAMERMSGPWVRKALVPTILSFLDGVSAKLERGAVVAEVGCGSGLALMTLAGAFPQSEFHGFDNSSAAIKRAEEKTAAEGLKNVTLRRIAGEDLPREPAFDLVITLQCLHDMTRPDKVISSVRKTLKPDGTWLIKESKSHPDFEENLKNPMCTLQYGYSILSCLLFSTSEPDGMGLGLLGFNPLVARKMLTEGGFSHFKQHETDDSLYYEVQI
ncbi:methyltransferase domain-containing protein [Thermodesulfobacteriota bacterium]